ncbi:ribonuclease HI family protein [Planococcus lenghuensis]|uniref:Ribonuclease HI n=1 Tax=Planococcus lenghuensis TaxID=2213202 RepID=A0A1Q2KZI9_9BACL|nr:ribonuclease HI family protein [Planococcus lenghuensis]AQQ53544.1 ribonuclease HI [Planococcus lenghuensis]
MLEVFTDAATAGNPRVSAVGVFIRGEGHQVKLGEFVGEMDNHEAEFSALVRGLQEAAKLTAGMVSVKSDSKVAVDAFERGVTRNERFKPYLTKALELADTFDYCFIKWIPDSENRAADALAKETLRANK